MVSQIIERQRFHMWYATGMVLEMTNMRWKSYFTLQMSMCKSLQDIFTEMHGRIDVEHFMVHGYTLTGHCMTSY